MKMEKRINWHYKNLPKLKKQKLVKCDVMCCASFNDWIPMRMKTARIMKLEKLAVDMSPDDIPRHVYQMDNMTNMCGAMVPPGTHYFYFVKERSTIFLSPKYEVVRFKTTNIFLNKIQVKKRLEDIETVHQLRDGEDDELIFIKDRSVFKDYREDNDAFLKKCFDMDISWGKI